MPWPEWEAAQMNGELRRFPTPALDRLFYESIRARRTTFRLAEELYIPKETGKGFVVRAGQSLQLICVEGPQVADMDVFNFNDPKERLWANQTLNREGAHLTTFSRLWGNMPHFRPLMTIIEDTVETVPTAPGARHHIILGAHCNPYYWLIARADMNHSNCYMNLVSAIAPFGLGAEHVHDNLNVFQKTRIDVETSRYVSEASDAKPGDYVEFFAEIDVLVAVSACPGGSLRHPAETGLSDTKPLLVKIFDTGIEPRPFSYAGNNASQEPRQS
jgi:uncharacterized protein YcgI (DUF1989 family)